MSIDKSLLSLSIVAGDFSAFAELFLQEARHLHGSDYLYPVPEIAGGIFLGSLALGIGSYISMRKRKSREKEAELYLQNEIREDMEKIYWINRRDNGPSFEDVVGDNFIEKYR